MQTETDNLIIKNFKLVHSICHTFSGEYDDLFQIGCIGLVKAARTYKPEKGYAFSTYAVPIIRNEILMSLRKKRPSTVSLEEPIGTDKDGNTMTLQDTLASRDDTERGVINFDEMKHKVDKLKSLMNPKFLAVFNGYLLGMRQAEISAATGISRVYVNKMLMRIRDAGALIDKDYQDGSTSKMRKLGRV